jgi:hypothetical protein
MMKLYLTPKQKRLLLELAAETDTKFYDLDHMEREAASKRIDYLLEMKRRKEAGDGRAVR